VNPQVRPPQLPMVVSHLVHKLDRDSLRLRLRLFLSLSTDGIVPTVGSGGAAGRERVDASPIEPATWALPRPRAARAQFGVTGERVKWLVAKARVSAPRSSRRAFSSGVCERVDRWGRPRGWLRRFVSASPVDPRGWEEGSSANVRVSASRSSRRAFS